jgi:hypothetical protein
MAVVRRSIAAADLWLYNGVVADVYRPANALDGDLIVAWVTSEHTPTTFTADQAGWTSQGHIDGNTGGGQSGELYTRRAASGDPVKWTFTVPDGQGVTHAFAYDSDTGGQQAALDQKSVGMDTSGPAITTASITPSVNNCIVNSMPFVDETGGTIKTWTPTSPATSGNGVVELLDWWSNNSATLTATILEETQTTATATSHTSTHTGTRSGIYAIWSVKEESAGAAEYTDSGSVRLNITGSATEVYAGTSFAGTSFDEATISLKLTPSGAEVYAGTSFDAATALLKFTPSGTDVLTGGLFDAATISLRLTPSGVDEYTPFIPPPPTITVYPPYVPTIIPVREWKIVHYNNEDDPIAEIQPEQLTFADYLNRVGYVQYEIDMENEYARASYVYPYRTNYRLYWGTEAIQGGLHTAVSIEDIESDKLGVTGNDWLHYFERRIFPFDPLDLTTGTYIASVNTDVYVIAKHILDTVLAVAGSYTFVYTIGTSGQTINQFKIERGDTATVFEKLTNLMETKPGFDIEVTYDRNIYFHLKRGNPNNPFVFETGKNIQMLSYTNNGPTGTWSLGLAQGTSGRTGRAKLSDAVATYKRLDAPHDYNEVRDISQLQALVDADSERDVAPNQEFSFRYVPEEDVNIFDEVGIGDICKVHISSKYEETNDPMRIVGRQVTVEPTGEIEVEFTVDDATLSL